MKNLYMFGLIAATLLICQSYAQPVLTAENTNQSAGESFSYINFNPAGTSPVSWDFNWLTSTGESFMYFSDPSVTGYASLFPNANIALDLNGTYTFYSATSSEYTVHGYEANGVVIVLSDPEKFLTYTVVNGVSLPSRGYYINQYYGIHESLSSKSCTIFPNPSNGKLFLNVNEPYSKISVSDLNGKIIYEKNIGSLTGTINVDLSGYGKGIYMLDITSKNTVSVNKLVIM